MEYSSKWNSSKRNTPIIIKMEHSSKWNTPIIIKMELIKMEPSYYYQNGTHQNGTLILKIANMYHGMRTLIWNSPHQHALDYREEPWILIK